MALERVQKILARAGVASRRAAEEVMTAGRVRVNGRIVTELGTRADAHRDKIEVDGRRIVAEARVVLLMHKPRGTVTTASDPEGRPTVIDLVRPIPLRLYPVGRLDFQTSGALLLTNDGDLAAVMLHPKRHVPKVYLVKLAGQMQEEDVDRWRKGVQLEDGKTLPATVSVVDRGPDATWLEVTLVEGRNQQIRRMGEATGFVVSRLTRLSFAGIGIEGLRAGQWRFLTAEELRDMATTYGAPKRIREILAEHEKLRDLPPARPAWAAHTERTSRRSEHMGESPETAPARNAARRNRKDADETPPARGARTAPGRAGRPAAASRSPKAAAGRGGRASTASHSSKPAAAGHARPARPEPPRKRPPR